MIISCPAAAGKADFLLTGDKHDLLALKAYQGTRIVSVRNFLTVHRKLPRREATDVRGGPLS